ncbi:Uncharacterised protein [Bordetella pertussis]|nr:Uncharacterised protein [Bordetella pertussis]CFM09458.1 Uncharacterised protein [Bordetella pertussis]CFN58180.1 Uncharacterised protein [Bordetella pertussis]CFN59813.1 Uncharacterised protein [Bordetella pertussis]CFN76022.1 Uncharacterised protein [Bordetella pertussis]
MLEGADQAQRGAAQAERVALAGGRQADAPDADQGFDALGDEQRGRGQRGGVDRRVIAVAVLRAQGGDHVGGLAVALGVVGAHDALQLGELAHHVRAQVGLGQQRGAVAMGGVAAQRRGDAARDGAHALDAFELGAQLVVVDDAAQLLDARGQRGLAVGLEEELGVGQARTHHALVAFDDVGRVGHLHVADDQEAVRQLAAGRVEQREVLLVQPHGQDQALLRHLQELFLELPDIDRGVFDQGGHFVQQGRDFGVVAQRGAQPLRVLVEQARNLGAARLERGNDAAALGQVGLVALGRGELDGAVALEAVPLRGAAGLQAQRRDRHDVGAEQGHQPVRRAHELDGGLAVGQLVAHHLGNGQAVDGGVQPLLQPDGQLRAGGRAARHQVFLLAIGLAFQRGRIQAFQALGGQLLGQRGGGLAVGVQADLHRHQFLGVGLLGGLGQHGRQAHRQPARRGERLDRAAVGQQMVARQGGAHAFGERLAQLLQGLGRQFFGKQFNQQGADIGGHVRLPPRRPCGRQAWGSPVVRGSRSRPARRRATGCGCGRCRRRARSR